MKKTNEMAKGQILEIIKNGQKMTVEFMGLTACHGKMYYRFRRVSDKLTVHLIIPELSANPEKNEKNLFPQAKQPKAKRQAKAKVEEPVETPAETPAEEIAA